MRFVTTQDATVLTELSTVTFREWTSRRALSPSDFLQKVNGLAAGVTWQTILPLRIVVTLRDRFHLKPQPHRTFESDSLVASPARKRRVDPVHVVSRGST